MNIKPHIALLALAVVCVAAVAWAADAPSSAPAPASHATHVAPAGHGGGVPVAADVEEEDGDDLGLGAIDIEDGPDGSGPGGDRRVIVRRFMRGGGAGAEGCGPACGPMRGGKGGQDCGPARGGMCGGIGGCSMGGKGGGKGECSMGGMGGGKGAGMGMGMNPGMLAHMAQSLDLTDAQRAKLADIHERQQRRDIQARADQQIARLDLRKAMTAEKPEAGAINAQIDRVAKLRTDMAKARVAALLEARAVLTPEQQKKLRDAHTQGPGADMPGMGPGCGMGPGGMGGRGMGHGGPPMRVKVQVERDTLIRK